MLMDQLIPFHKPNKKMRSEKMMDYLIPQTKHTINVLNILFLYMVCRRTLKAQQKKDDNLFWLVLRAFVVAISKIWAK